MTEALDILHAEHRAIAAVLHCFDHVADEVREGELAPEFDLFDAVLAYMREFPDRFHHPKEDRYLFPAVKQRAPEEADNLAELAEQHVEGERLLADLQWKLDDWRKAPEDEAKATAFLDGAKAYVDSQRRHAAREERTVMRVAREKLTAEDWTAINAALDDNDDPIFGARPKQAFSKLFSRIVELAPTPWGLAERHAPPPRDEDGEVETRWDRWDEAQRQAVLRMNWI